MFGLFLFFCLCAVGEDIIYEEIYQGQYLAVMDNQVDDIFKVYVEEHLGVPYDREKLYPYAQRFRYDVNEEYEASGAKLYGKIVFSFLPNPKHRGTSCLQEYYGKRYGIDAQNPEEVSQIDELKHLAGQTRSRWYFPYQYNDAKRQEIGINFLYRIGYKNYVQIQQDTIVRFSENYNMSYTNRHWFAKKINDVYADRLMMQICVMTGIIHSFFVKPTQTTARDIEKIDWRVSTNEAEKIAIQRIEERYLRGGIELAEGALWIEKNTTQKWYEDFNLHLGFGNQVGDSTPRHPHISDYIPHYMVFVYSKLIYYPTDEYGFFRVGVDARNGEIVGITEVGQAPNALFTGYDLKQIRKRKGLQPYTDAQYNPIIEAVREVQLKKNQYIKKRIEQRFD